MAQVVKNKKDWFLIVIGILMGIAAIVLMCNPLYMTAINTMFISIFLGISFLVSGIGGLVSYSQIRKLKVEGQGWLLFISILDIIVSLIFIGNPFVAAQFTVIIIGVTFIVTGVAMIAALFSRQVRQSVPWPLVLIVGIIFIGVGIAFFPTGTVRNLVLLAYFVAAIILVRGIQNIVHGIKGYPEDEIRQ